MARAHRLMRLSVAALLLAACAAPAARPPATAEPDAAARADTVRVVTYNIFAGNDLERRSNLDRIAALLDTLRADIVLLQEVDRLTARSGGVDQAAVLAEATGLHVVFGRSIDFGGGEYGNAILSRWPVRAARVVPLDSLLPAALVADVQEARTLLHVIVDMPGGTLHVANTHLDHRATSTVRQPQALALLAYLADAVPPGEPLVLGGDLNARPDAVEVRALGARFTDAWTACGTGPGFTFRTDQPDRRIDYVLLSGAACAAARVLDRPLSDHLPVVVDVVIRRRTARPGPDSVILGGNPSVLVQGDALKKSFTITREALEAADAATLMSEIVSGTGNELEAASVLRSLERLGTDPGIDFYEITQVPGRRMHGGPATHAWRVRADRGIVEVDESAAASA
jgi:endonuclease/exonuclease/phosphatase family metal-dependent hydrolase